MYNLNKVDVNFITGKSEFALELLDGFLRVNDRFHEALERELNTIPDGGMTDDAVIRVEMLLGNARYMQLLLAMRSIGDHYQVAFNHFEAINAIEDYFTMLNNKDVVDIRSAIKSKAFPSRTSFTIAMASVNKDCKSTTSTARLRVV